MSKTPSYKHVRVALLVAVVFLGGFTAPSEAWAQTAQRFSLQVSGLASAPFGGGLSGLTVGPGFEAQVRFNPSAFSIGVGFDMTFHTVEGAEDRSTTLAGGFIEPRYVIYIGNDRAAPYISARAAVSQTGIDFGTETSTATGFTLNGGGGVLIALNDRANIDLGATLGFKDVGVVTSPIGTFDLGSGGNLIVRLGVAFGLGG